MSTPRFCTRCGKKAAEPVEKDGRLLSFCVDHGLIYSEPAPEPEAEPQPEDTEPASSSADAGTGKPASDFGGFEFAEKPAPKPLN